MKLGAQRVVVEQNPIVPNKWFQQIVVCSKNIIIIIIIIMLLVMPGLLLWKNKMKKGLLRSADYLKVLILIVLLHCNSFKYDFYGVFI